jgi:hypothetical protein
MSTLWTICQIQESSPLIFGCEFVLPGHSPAAPERNWPSDASLATWRREVVTNSAQHTKRQDQHEETARWLPRDASAVAELGGGGG